MAAETVTSPTLSPSSLHGSMYSATTVPPEVTTVTKTLQEMKGSLGNLGAMLDAVGQNTAHMVQIGGEIETARHLNKVRQDLAEQDRRQEAQIEEIKAVLQKALEYDVIEHLRQLIDAGIMEQIDELVKEQVAAQLPSYFPQELQDELDRHMFELDQVQRALHNSESRRANSQLRSNHLKDPLHTIYKSDGTISPHFPRDVHSLFSMDADTAKSLMEEYGLTDISESRERNVNRFMQFCGVTYQLVTTKGGGHVVLKTKAAAFD
ncbi:unnamed protein product [Somion occarium]|uniref:Uncharacterized protein n=1 Tax=Somion occarium TaxID=3059160 RepID=A0ABP1DYJ6_9APHY